ncbi:PREDICTED: deoxyhypusine synthase [Prunus dulcis]|uniref:PREDICTED: deoxyhypusine synthase n=1 Tax=Prunus dulcis TaxID=3755 RepID=A0A5E4G8V5_PRUDU|nr:PREDICTED: deoxyhypusine synthase [Prunus dulcis]
MALFQRWVVQWVQVCKDGLRDGDCRDGLCDDSVSKGRGCAVELVVSLMGCVCKRREFSMGWGLIWDEVGFDIRWVTGERTLVNLCTPPRAKDLRSSSASSLHSTLQLSVKLMN